MLSICRFSKRQGRTTKPISEDRVERALFVLGLLAATASSILTITTALWSFADYYVWSAIVLYAIGWTLIGSAVRRITLKIHHGGKH